MFLSSNLIATTIVALTLAVPAVADVVLSKKIMDLALISAELSSLAYEEDPPGDGFDHFGFFDEEPDQAIVGEREGYCFAAFRGTTLTWVDWKQNLKLGNEDVCRDELFRPSTCCSVRRGFYHAYYTGYQAELEKKIRECAKTCSNPNECVVFTGHSQGGAIAAVAGVAMSDLNPYVITFGQPPTIEAPCPLISSERWYRFVNTKDSDVGIAYDPVPFVPGLGAGFFGHMIMLGQDTTGIAYIGLDANDDFGPLNIKGFEAHNMLAAGLPFPGYTDRLKSIVANSTGFPIRADGFADNTLCSSDKECQSGKCAREITFAFPRCTGTECSVDEDCDTNRCDNGSCHPKLGSCMECNEDSDCAGGKCTGFRCSNLNGFMDDNCNCHWDSDCQSGRCELLETGTCEAKLPIGARCNEHSDCASDSCSWTFVCEAKLPLGSVCSSSSSCESGSCSWFRCREGEASTTETSRKSFIIGGNSTSLHPSSYTPILFAICVLTGIAALVDATPRVLNAYRRHQAGYYQVDGMNIDV